MEEIKNISTLQELIGKETGVMVYFYNDDCPPCISLRPKVDALMRERFPRMKLAWVNSKTTPDVPASHGVFSNPTILVFFDGREFRRFSKYVSVAELESAVARYYDLAFEQT